MKTFKLYVAPCWFVVPRTETTYQGEKQLTIRLFGQELNLVEGLRRMNRRGWDLIRIQPNGAPLVAHIPTWHRVDFYYLFERSGARASPTSHC